MVMLVGRHNASIGITDVRRLCLWERMVTFLASIAMLASAIQVAGDGGCRLKLDLDDTQVDAIVQLMAMRGEVLQVTV